MEERKYSIYKHTFPNGLAYYGITKQIPEIRWANGNGYHFGRISQALREYNWNEVKHEILASGLTEKDAKRLEKELIECCANGTTLNVGHTLNQEPLIKWEGYLIQYCDVNTYSDIMNKIRETLPSLPCYDVMIYADRVEAKMLDIKYKEGTDIPTVAYEQDAVAYYPDGFMRKRDLIPWIKTAEFVLKPIRKVDPATTKCEESA